MNACFSGSSSKIFMTGLFSKALLPIKSSWALLKTEIVSLQKSRQSSKLSQERLWGRCSCKSKKTAGRTVRSFSEKPEHKPNIYQAYWDEKAASKAKNSKNPNKWASGKRFDDIYRHDDIDKPKRMTVRRTWTEFREPVKRNYGRNLTDGTICSELALRPRKARSFSILPAEETELDLD